MSASLGDLADQIARPPNPARSLTPRVFWGPAAWPSSILRTRNEEKIQKYWMMANHWECPKKKTKTKWEKTVFRKAKEIQVDTRKRKKKKIRLFWQNTNFITKYYTHTPTDWLLEVVQGVPTTKRSRKSRTPCKFGHKYTHHTHH